MSVVNAYQNVAYGLSGPLVGVPAYAIISPRAPTVNDKAPFGQLWVDQTTNTIYFLTSITSNQAMWINPASEGGSGAFTTVTASSTITAGGNISTTGSGNISTTGTGNISSAAALTVGTGITVTGTGANIVTNSGNIQASGGALIAGATSAPTVASGQISISGFVNPTQSSGALTILSPTATSHTNTGLIQIDVAGQTAYIPYFANIS